MLYYKGKIARNNDDDKCFLCNNKLNLKIGYKNKIKIEGCSNEDCLTNKNTEWIYKRNAFVEKEIIKNRLINNTKKRKDKNNPLKIQYWLSHFYTEKRSYEKITEIKKLLNNGFNISNVIKEHKKILKEHGISNSYFHISYWIERGFTEDDAKNKITDYLDKTSNLRLNYWIERGFTEDDAKNKISEIQREYAKRVNYKTRILSSNIQYWINKGYNEHDAKIEMNNFTKKNYSISKINCKDYDLMMQRRKNTWNTKSDDEKEKINKSRGKTFEQLIQIHGIEKTNEIIDKRCSVFKEKNWSKISKELFVRIEELINKECFYAENEKLFYFNKKIYYPDFYDGENFIIEFYGDIFHGNPKIFSATDKPNPFNNLTAKEIWDKDKDRISVFKNNGFYVCVVWETDYRNNKNKIINKILEEYDKKNNIKYTSSILF